MSLAGPAAAAEPNRWAARDAESEKGNYEHKGMYCYRFHFGPRHMYLRLWGWAITEAVSNACTILNANLTPLSHAIGDKDIFAFIWF